VGSSINLDRLSATFQFTGMYFTLNVNGKSLKPKLSMSNDGLDFGEYIISSVL